MCEDLYSLEFPQLSTGIFADYGGSSPISQSQIAKIEEYSSNISAFYSIGGKPSKAEQEIEAFKEELLTHFHTNKDEYKVIFSNNTTGAIRELAYSFPWSKGGMFIHHADNHNSILGIRNIAMKRGAQVLPVGSFPKMTGTTHNLFSFPLQSNFSGKKYPLEWIKEFQDLSDPEHGKFCQVLVDAAAYVPSCDLDLSKYKPDFVVFSLLKMCGSPGGVLLIRNESLPLISEIHQEPFDEISIIAARSGLQVRHQFEQLLQKPISKHVYDLATDFHNKMSKLKHFNRKPVVELYPSEWRPYDQQGGIVAFNIRNARGHPVAHDGIFTAATANSIFLRFGLHCNPGGTYMALGWDPDEIKQATQQHESACSLTASIMTGKNGNKHVGSIRASFGFPSTQKDVDQLVAFFESHFAEKEIFQKQKDFSEQFKLSQVFIHPIKGCQGIELFKGETEEEQTNPWPMKQSGLLYDQYWAVADELSTLLDRNRCPLLARIKTQIKDNKLIITTPDGKELTVPANEIPKGTDFTSSTVCHEKISGSIYPPDVNQWWTDVLGRKAVFVRVTQTEMVPFRAVFTSSLLACGVTNLEQLRPHFVFESSKPFIEDNLLGQLRTLSDSPFRISRMIPMSTEVMIDCEKLGETVEPLKSICLLHSPDGVPTFGLELRGQFKPTRKNPKELVPNSVM